jgi:drug/metabolite transporter (DMT)-like permease
MVYLLLTILTTSLLFILFRWYSALKINIFQTIVWNYVTCSLTGLIHQMNILSIPLYSKHMDTILWASIMGCGFLPSFFIIGTSTRIAGMTPTTMANKLSMIIPVTFALIFGFATFSLIKVLAIALGILSIFIITRHNKDNNRLTSHSLLPWIVFITGGLLDLALMYLNKHIVTAESTGLFSIHVFVSAAICGLISLSIILLLKKGSFEWKAILSGILLGIPNYFSVYFLLKTLDYYHHDGSFVFPSLNLSIILVSAMASVLFFREKLSKSVILGLLIACSSIVLLYFSKSEW